MVDAGVHEGAVMANDEYGAVVVGDKTAQPLDAFEVQVVGGLVQKQQVGVAQEELSQRDTHLPAARELGARALKVGDFKAEAGQDLACVALELVAAQVLKAVLDLAVLVKECVDVLALFGELGDLGLQLVGALAHAADFLGRRHDLGKDGGVLLLQVGFLFEIAHLAVFGVLDLAGVGAVDAHDDLEHGGFAGAVGSYKRKALAGVDLEGRAAKEDARAEAFFDLVDQEDHGAAFDLVCLYEKRPQLALEPHSMLGWRRGGSNP